MAITEKTRHELYQRLEQVLGPEQAATLMEHLPPVGWADVATKRDLDHLGARIDHLAEATSLRLDSFADRLRAEFHRDLRTAVLAMVGTNVTTAALVVAAVRVG